MEKKHAIVVLFFLLYLMTHASPVSSPTLPPGVHITMPPLPSMYYNMTLPTYYYNMTLPTYYYTTPSTTAFTTTTLAGEATETTNETPPGGEVQQANATTVCGGDMEICYVELDMTGDGKPECCSQADNPTCRLCLTPCGRLCQTRGEGVKYCFGTDTAYGCECTEDKPPTCYTTTTLPEIAVSTTTPGLVESVKSNTNLLYVLLLIAMVLILFAVVYYVRSL